VTSWSKAVEDYVDLRRSLGFKLVEAKVSLIQFAAFLKQSRTGVLMIRKPRCHRVVCCLTGLGGRIHTCTATRRSSNCLKPRGSCRRHTVSVVRPITACWGCWP